uniref:Uncharacterized protein n=1 Tax=Cacopsylla melanoneura TaxID=428564 RepID=A0A8D8ZTS9_9HEMI
METKNQIYSDEEGHLKDPQLGQYRIGDYLASYLTGHSCVSTRLGRFARRAPVRPSFYMKPSCHTGCRESSLKYTGCDKNETGLPMVEVRGPRWARVMASVALNTSSFV